MVRCGNFLLLLAIRGFAEGSGSLRNLMAARRPQAGDFVRVRGRR
jgi:hypothetical protein